MGCYKYILLCASAMMLSIASWAQAPVYTCDFETETSRNQWILNAIANPNMKLENQWYIGAAGHFAPQGSNGLFISADNGVSAEYTGEKTMFVAASCDMPNMPAGNYNLYFDWQCNAKAGVGEGFYVCWVPDSIKTNGATGAGSYPQWVKDYWCKSADGNTLFAGEGVWTIGKVSIEHDGTPHKLVFLWFSTKGKVVPPAACIDNIELRPENTCVPPTQVSHQIKGDTVVLNWKGNASYYEVKCYDFTNGTWIIRNNIKTNTCELPHIEEGVQTFILRAFCDNNSASDYVQYTQLIYHKGIRCIDYMELTNQNCFTGKYANPIATKGKVDKGYADLSSRHTLHYMPNEYDPYTNYELITCPSGYLASVRLGNGDNGNGEGEAIEYKYKVLDGATGVLKIKYAAVLSNPHPENPAINPRFWLDVLRNGKRIPQDCGYAYFTSGDDAASGWKPGVDGWLYKPWTEHAINLRDYVGETLTIRLVTTDCEPGAHTGYAYFVLDCESGEMSGLNCGENNPTTQFTAPAGFDYVWYSPENPLDTLSRERIFDIQPLDTNVYNVNVINKNNANCWYTLSVLGLPRIPTPDVTYEAKVIRCKNIVTFTNKSCVYRKNQITQRVEPTSEPVTGLQWNFGDGTEISNDLREVVTHTYPDEGGTFTLKLTATVGDGSCPVEKTYQLTLPDLSSPVTEVEKHICRADPNSQFGFSYGEPATIFYENVDSTFIYIAKRTGCDSLCHLALTFHEKGPFPYEDTICYGDTLRFFGQRLTQSGAYTENLQNKYGCDSIIQVNLFVDPKVVANVPDTVNICPEEKTVNIPFNLKSGRVDEIELLFDEKGHIAGFEPEYAFPTNINMLTIDMPAKIRPDVYPATLVYATPLCNASNRSLYVQVCYSASIIQQRPRFLMLQNEEYNGGYRFQSHQWFRDGKPIEKGGTGANLAVSPDDMGHEFYVVLVREGETTPVRTCSVWYGRTPIDEVHISEMNGPLHIFSVLGEYLGIVQEEAELNQLPSGLYIVTNGDKATKIIR